MYILKAKRHTNHTQLQLYLPFYQFLAKFLPFVHIDFCLHQFISLVSSVIFMNLEYKVKEML